MKALLASVLCASLPAQADTMSVHTCAEVGVCNTQGRCVETESRFAFAQIHRADEGEVQYFSMGPLLFEAGGGLFHETALRVEETLPDLTDIDDYDAILRREGASLTAHIFRPAREVTSRLGRSHDWVRADYSCTQVMF